MKKPPPVPPFPPHDKKEAFPPALLDELRRAGLDTSGLLWCCSGDMTNDGAFKDMWLCFDAKGVYIAYGAAKVDRAKKKKKHRVLDATYTVDSISSIPLEDLSGMETERYVSTGRLTACENGQTVSLARFSIGKLPAFDNFAKVFNHYKETGEVKPPEHHGPEERVCRKCGGPCPPGMDVCPKCTKNSATAVRLVKFFGGYVPQIAVILFFMLLSAGVTVFVPQISTRSLFDNVIANPDGKTVEELLKALAVLVGSIFGIRLLNTLLTVVEDYVTASVMPQVTYDIKLKIFAAMQRLSVNFYSSKQTGSLMERIIQDANQIYWFFIEGVPRLIIESATVIGVVIIMFTMNWRLTLIVSCAVPLIACALYFGDKFFRGMHHNNFLFRSKLSSMVSDNINGQRVIKAFAKEDEEYGRFSDLNDKYRGAELKLALAEATLIPSIEVAVIILSAVILGMGGTYVIQGKMTTGTLLSYVVYLELLRQPLQFLSWTANWWSRCADSAQRVFEVCDAEPEITEKENAVTFDDLQGEIEINELDFEYEPARPVIKHLSLHVKAGQMLGIVGKTGAGKTTIANLIARLYDAKGGSVKIDGIDVRDLKLSELRRNIGLVSQDIYLFIGSIADNIRYARPEASMDEVIAAAKAAHAHDFIMKLPDAYETRVGAGGQKLSGGERQRISIARTIIQNPKILILDEATAAMDTETERNIQNSLAKLKTGRTTIAIAHRLSTLRDADELAVISDGTITEQGAFRELIEKQGEFYRQYKLQQEALKAVGIAGDAAPDGESDEDDAH